MVQRAEHFASASVSLVNRHRAVPEAGGRLQAPDQEIRKGADLLSQEALSGPVGTGRPHRVFNLGPQFSGEEVVVLALRRGRRRLPRVPSRSTGSVSVPRVVSGSWPHVPCGAL